MTHRKPTVVTATELQRTYATILKRCYKHKECFIVERAGFPVAIVLPIDEYERLKEVRSKR